MQITVKFKLELTEKQVCLVQTATKKYIRLVNQIVADFVKAGTSLKYTSRTVTAELPSAVKCQAVRDAKSIFAKYKKNVRANARLRPEDQKEVKIPVLKKPVAVWNNQNYSLKGSVLSFPVLVNNRSVRMMVRAALTEYQKQRLFGKLDSLRITQKSGKFIAQIAVKVFKKQPETGKTMGVDLGLKVPAVAVVEGGKTKFFGNGRQNKFIKRKRRTVRKKLGKLKKLSAIRKRHDKEQRWMKDQDHKISRQIINFAKDSGVSTVRLEKLSGIRQTARTSRKNEKNLHSWSFYRLAQYIEYKALLAGIKVEYVNPKHTSQRCPACDKLNKARDRKYKCSCGYQTHRDRVGAINIISAAVAGGRSLSA